MIGLKTHEKAIISDLASDSPFVRAYVGLFEQLCLATAQEPRRMILVTSACRGEGRTTVAMNLALCCAALGGGKTLLVDADLQHPTLARMAKVDGSHGLCQALGNGQAAGNPDTWRECIQPVREGSLWLLPAGCPSALSLAAAPAERLESLTGQWCTAFDWVIVDTPPVLASAIVLALGRHAAGALLVIRAGRTRTETVALAANRLRDCRIRLLGSVLNRRSLCIPGYVYQRM